MKRICFLVPNADSAHGIVDDIRQLGIDDSDIYVVANDEVPLGDMPDAGAVQESDFYPQLRRGLAMGGTVGIIGGLIAMRVAGSVFGGGAVLLFGLIGAGFSALLASMAGAAFPNSRLNEFEKAVESGHVLVMVDVPRDRVAEVERIVGERHPEIEVEKLEARTPLIPHR